MQVDATQPKAAQARLVGSLVAGFLAAIVLRVAIGTPHVATSESAGLAFAVALYAMALISRPRIGLRVTNLLIGAAAGAALCLPVVAARMTLVGAHRPEGSYARWALTVAVVAVSEEVFLRGALRDAVTAWRGSSTAIAVGAVCFAVLHLPLYGLSSAPLDLGVGLILGWLRERTKSVAAPASAHVVADLIAWWLR